MGGGDARAAQAPPRTKDIPAMSDRTTGPPAAGTAGRTALRDSSAEESPAGGASARWVSARRAARGCTLQHGRGAASAAGGEAGSGDGGGRLGREGGGDRQLGSAQRARQAAATGISTHAKPSGEALQLSALRLTDERDDVPVAAARGAGGRGVPPSMTGGRAACAASAHRRRSAAPGWGLGSPGEAGIPRSIIDSLSIIGA